MSINEATMRVSDKPKIQYYDITFKCDTISSTDNILIQNSAVTMEYDLKNKIVSLGILEFPHSNFYNLLNNILASTNIGVLIINKASTSILGSNNIYTRSYEIKYPYLYFRAGTVQKHLCGVNLRDDDEVIHNLNIKFTKFSARFDDTIESL